jgi:glycosyltransferase involved in cell wall biosynthesis
LKILIISPTQSGIGGIAQHVSGLANFLTKKGHEVKIMSSENTFTVPIRGLKNPSFMVSSFLKSKFQKGFDIVHAHNVPAAVAMKNISGKKLLSLQGMFSDQVELLHGDSVGKISASLEKKAIDWADAITVPSLEMQDFYSQKGYHVYHVPNAIDISALPTTVDRKYEKQILYAGRLSKEKGILDLLEAAKGLPEDIHLIILGSGPEEDKVNEVAKEKSNIHYLGYQPKEKTISLIRGSDILVQPSVMEGGTSSTLLEAMACKVPIIATRVGGNKETINHMKTAFVVEPNSPKQILDAILELLSDKQKRDTLIENAFKTVQEYDWESVGQKYLEIYNILCQKS